MLIVEFFSWWYSAGWKTVLSDIRQRFQFVYSSFSVAIITKTLFAPWRRIISYPGTSVGDHFRAGVNNLIGRVIGMFIRLAVLFAAAVLCLIIALSGVVEIIAWPLLPIAVVVFLIRGIV
jgi:hypothetical protein